MGKSTLYSPFSHMSTPTMLLIAILTILLAVVVWRRLMDEVDMKEGFQQQDMVVLKEGPEIYDDFYASIYDMLVFNQVKNSYEVGQIVNSTKPTTESKILDIGSGTGHHVGDLSSQGFNTTGLDISSAMITKAKENYPDSKFVNGDAMNGQIFSPNTFTHITCLYFGIYYMKNKSTFFANCFKWLMPGGHLIVHIVDREMFDPILPPANPLIIVSPQKYAKERITNSNITFNNMKYKANFDMQPNSDVAVFNERFEGNDGKIRKQKHVFHMEDEKQIVTMAEQAGFLLQGKVDLLQAAYEYQYLYVFRKPN